MKCLEHVENEIFVVNEEEGVIGTTFTLDILEIYQDSNSYPHALQGRPHACAAIDISHKFEEYLRGKMGLKGILHKVIVPKMIEDKLFLNPHLLISLMILPYITIMYVQVLS